MQGNENEDGEGIADTGRDWKGLFKSSFSTKQFDAAVWEYELFTGPEKFRGLTGIEVCNAIRFLGSAEWKRRQFVTLVDLRQAIGMLRKRTHEQAGGTAGGPPDEVRTCGVCIGGWIYYRITEVDVGNGRKELVMGDHPPGFCWGEGCPCKCSQGEHVLSQFFPAKSYERIMAHREKAFAWVVANNAERERKIAELDCGDTRESRMEWLMKRVAEVATAKKANEEARERMALNVPAQVKVEDGPPPRPPEDEVEELGEGADFLTDVQETDVPPEEAGA